MANGVPIPESKILKLRDPTNNDENNWATFDLRNVEVVDKKGTLVNLLHADADYPVTVTGTLQITKGNAGLLLPSATRSKNVTISVKNVSHIAYGAYANGDVDFWAAGLAGWHCVKPAESYTAIFQEMIEAVHIFYFVADSYGGQARPKWDELFSNSRPISSRATKPTATARLTEAKPSRSSRRSRLTEAEEVAATRSRETRNSQHRGPLLSEVNKSKARDLWKFMQKTVNNSQPSAADVTLDRFAHLLVQFYTFEDVDSATEFLQVLAADLVPLMQAKRRRAYAWTDLPIYDDLLECKPTAAAKRRVAAMDLEPRAHPLSDDEEIPSAESESEEEVLDDSEIHHSMSVLRPKSGTKFSGKGASRKGKGKAPQRDDSEPQDDEAEIMEVDTPSKRKSVSEDEEEESPPRKRFTRSQGDHDQELEDLEFEAQQAKSTGIPLRKKSQSSDSRPAVAAPVIVSEPIFTTRAQEPGDVWTCPREGCLHKVYGASDNRELIKEHHLEHDEIFNLVKSEENRTHLPVSALLKRIRQMAESQHGPRLGQMGVGGDNSPITTIFPAPIMRRV
ncbi:hypothetical protein FKW77_006836 [Venturia effusa]|uniref:DNA (cytosine-5)-methyltransferase 1 replication foci domain-containing protein n=1 Tax=Venturia effusa TaxID=50376 RepID=A0A517LPC9_9PEZI|nr:hypothetical protein FKW77_006836 [Venturia effusa]